MQITVMNKKINYEAIGEGSPVVVLHGWLTSLDTMRMLSDILSMNHKVYLVDVVGFGKSESLDKPMTTDEYGDFLKEFISTLKIENPILIGHSHGGRMIINAVGRNLIKAKKIILIDSAGVKVKHGIKYYYKTLTYKAGKSILNMMPQTKYIKDTREELLSSRASDDYKASSPVLRKTMSNVLRENQEENAKKIDVPTLLLWGDKDTATPMYQARKLNKLIKDSKLEVIENGDHYSYLRDPKKTREVILNFLSEEDDK